ncbi:MAG: SLBB domain-containing protein [Deltaproteobacteria bacterium]|mgnify:CR=1 FL=1
MFKSRSVLCLLLTVYCLLPADLYAQEMIHQVGQAVPAGMTMESLNPAQRQAAQAELSKTGGQVTPEAIEALKKRPEFKDLKPEEVQKGKDLLEKKDAAKGEEKKPIEEKPSPLEVSTTLKPFGYDLFAGVSLTPPQDMPVASDYVVGPGDEISILLWGRLSGQYTLMVSRDGTIQLPNIGPLSVAGMTFDEMKKYLTRQAKNIVGAEINVTMGRLRSIQVFVLGEVKKPGAYSVSAMSTLTNALMASGGPTKIGTLRKIELKRNGNKTATTMDFYDLLLKGDKSKDLRLQNGDVVFVPPVGPFVAVAGSVKRPAIYELKGEVNIKGLIEMAGGITATGYLQRIQVERIHENEAKTLVDADFRELDKEKDIMLKDGDIINIFPITNVVINGVTLSGSVARPGQYQWFEGMRVSDIIKNTEKDLLPETYFDHALIERYIPPDYHIEVIAFNLHKALIDRDNNEDKLLQPYDTLTVYSKWDFQDRPKIRVLGAVNKPGEYELRPNMKVSDLVNLAGNVKRYAYLEQAELTRVTITNEGPKTERLILNLGKALSKDKGSDIPLKEDDYLFVRTVPEWGLYRTVNLSGEVKYPGSYTIKKGERFSSLLKRAGGFTDKAYLQGVVFTRESVKELQQKNLSDAIDRLEQQMLSQSAVSAQTALASEDAKQQQVVAEQQRTIITKMRAAKAQGRMVIRLDSLDKFEGSAYDIEVENGDSLTIPEYPNSIQVIGSVYNSTAFVYDPDISMSTYIDKAGGTTKYADEKETFVLKADGSAAARRQGGMFFMSSKLDPGDTVVVPEKVERIAWMKEIKDMTQILYQIAVTAGVLIVAF